MPAIIFKTKDAKIHTLITNNVSAVEKLIAGNILQKLERRKKDPSEDDRYYIVYEENRQKMFDELDIVTIQLILSRADQISQWPSDISIAQGFFSEVLIPSLSCDASIYEHLISIGKPVSGKEHKTLKKLSFLVSIFSHPGVQSLQVPLGELFVWLATMFDTRVIGRSNSLTKTTNTETIITHLTVLLKHFTLSEMAKIPETLKIIFSYDTPCDPLTSCIKTDSAEKLFVENKAAILKLIQANMLKFYDPHESGQAPYIAYEGRVNFSCLGDEILQLIFKRIDEILQWAPYSNTSNFFKGVLIPSLSCDVSIFNRLLSIANKPSQDMCKIQAKLSFLANVFAQPDIQSLQRLQVSLDDLFVWFEKGFDEGIFDIKNPYNHSSPVNYPDTKIVIAHLNLFLLQAFSLSEIKTRVPQKTLNLIFTRQTTLGRLLTNANQTLSDLIALPRELQEQLIMHRENIASFLEEGYLTFDDLKEEKTLAFITSDSDSFEKLKQLKITKGSSFAVAKEILVQFPRLSSYTIEVFAKAVSMSIDELLSFINESKQTDKMKVCFNCLNQVSWLINDGHLELKDILTLPDYLIINADKAYIKKLFETDKKSLEQYLNLSAEKQSKLGDFLSYWSDQGYDKKYSFADLIQACEIDNEFAFKLFAFEKYPLDRSSQRVKAHDKETQTITLTDEVGLSLADIVMLSEEKKKELVLNKYRYGDFFKATGMSFSDFLGWERENPMVSELFQRTRSNCLKKVTYIVGDPEVVSNFESWSRKYPFLDYFVEQEQMELSLFLNMSAPLLNQLMKSFNVLRKITSDQKQTLKGLSLKYNTKKDMELLAQSLAFPLEDAADLCVIVETIHRNILKMTPLHEAIWRGDIKQCKSIVDNATRVRCLGVLVQLKIDDEEMIQYIRGSKSKLTLEQQIELIEQIASKLQEPELGGKNELGPINRYLQSTLFNLREALQRTKAVSEDVQPIQKRYVPTEESTTYFHPTVHQSQRPEQPSVSMTNTRDKKALDSKGNKVVSEDVQPIQKRYVPTEETTTHLRPTVHQFQRPEQPSVTNIRESGSRDSLSRLDELYPFKNQQTYRYHFFTVKHTFNDRKTLKNDEAKRRILEECVRNFAEYKDKKSLDGYKKIFMASEEYKTLDAATGILTQLSKWLPSLFTLETSSVKAFKALYSEKLKELPSTTVVI